MRTSRSVAADFTFFLAIPTMFGYSGLKAVKFFLDGNVLNFSQFLILMVASVTAFLVSLYVIRFLTDYVKKHDFTIFGKYRIVLGTILILYSIAKKYLLRKPAALVWAAFCDVKIEKIRLFLYNKMTTRARYIVWK